ncbi:hypothetical protein N8X69_02700 [Opitutales bacterium]|nr:hypothetical protein [Opitutales bacterium]
MKRIKLLSVCCLFLLGCTEKNSMELSDFTSDGCSLFIDGTFEKPDLWKECCLTHDIAYWQGGTQEERLEADLAFKACVEKKTGDSTLAKLMYDAVRVGGEPYFPTWYRWGYGWPIGRGYQELSRQELLLVQAKLEKYRASQ